MVVEPDFNKVWRESKPEPIVKLCEGVKALFWAGVVDYGNDKALLIFTSNKNTGYITGRFLLPKEALLGFLKEKDTLLRGLGLNGGQQTV